MLFFFLGKVPEIATEEPVSDAGGRICADFPEGAGSAHWRLPRRPPVPARGENHLQP